MKKDLTKEEMLKRLEELEQENKRLKEENRRNKWDSINKEDAFESLKFLIKSFTQTYTSLWESMNMSDRTLRNFMSWTAEDASEKTYWIIWDYFSTNLKEVEKNLLCYRAYISAPDDSKRAEVYKKLVESYENMLKLLENLIHKRVYTIEERNVKASWEYNADWFIVYKWSELSYHVIEDSNIRIMRARKELYLDWFIEKNQSSHTVTFLKDCSFKSPSAAAEVICWRSVNWWWKWKSWGKTLDELERN